MIVGFPVTENQAKALRWEGIFPDYTVFLEAPVEALIERHSGNRIDPETGESYHLLMKPPPNLQVENRLIPHPDFSPNELREKIEAYKRENFVLQQIYATSARMFNADQPLTDVYASVLAYVAQPPRSLALRTPRILLLGYVGSGRKTQAKLLAGKYGLVPVDCSALINQEIASASLRGKAMKSYVARNMAVPDSIVVETVKSRLTQPDCTTRGWILHGYPRSKQQAELLDAEDLTPNRVFALDISHICAAERLTGRRIDPVTGQRFHLSNRPLDDDLSGQMLQNPQDRECVIGSKLAMFAAHKEQLYEYYASNLVHIHADVDIHTKLTWATLKFLETMHPATKDPLLIKYVDDNYLYNVFEVSIVKQTHDRKSYSGVLLSALFRVPLHTLVADSALVSGLAVMVPEAPRVWIVEKLGKVYDIGNENVRWDSFIDPRMRPQHPFVAQDLFRQWFMNARIDDISPNDRYQLTKPVRPGVFQLPVHGGLQDEDDVSFRPGSGILPGSKITYRDTLKKLPEYLRIKSDRTLLGYAIKLIIYFLKWSFNFFQIFEYLNPFDVGHAAQVSHNWMSIAERSYSNHRLDLSSLRTRIQDKILAKILKKRRVYLRYINLSRCDLLTQAGFRFLGTCVHLQDVNLSCCKQLTDEAVMHLMWECRDIVKLDLSRTPITDSAVRYIATAPNVLEHLILANCVKLSSACRVYLKETAGFRTLIYLDLSGCIQLESDALMEIFSSLPNVRHWILNNLLQLSNETLKITNSDLLIWVFRLAKSRGFPSLLNFAVAQILGSHCPIIETISLENSGSGVNPVHQEPSENNVEKQDTTGDEVSTIVMKTHVKKRTSKQLNPSKHPVDDEGLSWVVKRGIRKLFVSGLPGCRGHCFKQLAAETHNRKPSWSKPITNAISVNRNDQPMELIRQLYMTNCSNLTDSTLRDLAMFPSLVVINLSRCMKLTDVGVKCIAQSAYAPKLRELYLAGCGNLTDRSIICLDKRLPQLAYFSVAFCARISKPALMRLDRWKGLWQLNISGTDLDNRVSRSILQSKLPTLRFTHLYSFLNSVTSLKHLKKGCRKLECLLINGCHLIEKQDVLRWADRIPYVAHSPNKPGP
ncbi:hypothetical protein T265_11321 [Opisthorchis viverrini]|uniref:Adenylate kinase n=1 Tax=Opisthorchis viverrini TaxID=6198 RepID=A0A074ZXW8_OPIVI|nr:hypothetical protein T265_11321 [Opisthorchis viverrini]KER20039.1 hypothetical protein T265_11321 [Opisthorchis viverrini]